MWQFNIDTGLDGQAFVSEKAMVTQLSHFLLYSILTMDSIRSLKYFTAINKKIVVCRLKINCERDVHCEFSWVC
jgi:hypothetical protein